MTAPSGSPVVESPSTKRGAVASKRAKRHTVALDAKKTTQMNIRMGISLKKEGDRAFARIGRSPSDMARALWSYGARHANDSEALRSLAAFLEGEDAPHHSEEARDRIATMHSARNLIDNFFEEHSLSLSIPEPYESLDEYLSALRESDALARLQKEELA